MRKNGFLFGVFAGLALGLVLLGSYFRHALNADAVAYLRIASYYAMGKWDLAVSGYWGPMTSWLIALLLKLGLPPLTAARVFMGFSAAVFFWGCAAVFRAFGLPEKWVRTGAVLSAAASAYWSVQFITPDLLLSGLIAFAVSRMLTTGFKTAGSAAVNGILWGLAYLTKAVALPLAILSIGRFGGLAWRAQPSERRHVWRQAGLTLVMFLLVGGPWMLMLSLKYGKPTFSTAAAISHTLTGPEDVDRYHPFARTIQPPEAGRITSWEEPSRAAYKYWSPFDSVAYARHQLKVLVQNASTAFTLLTSLNAGWLVLFVELGLGLLRRRSAPVSARTWGRALAVPAMLALIYLPCYFTLTEQRFFYAAFPFLFSALALWVLSGSYPSPHPSPRGEGEEGTVALRIGTRAGWFLTVVGAVLPLLASVLVVGARPKMAGDYAADLARRLERAHLAGPVVGSAMLPGGRTGLYVAFLLNQPWYGDQPDPKVSSLQFSGAHLVLVIRDSDLAAELAQDPGFVDLDARLFAEPEQADRYPLKVFRITPVQASARHR